MLFTCVVADCRQFLVNSAKTAETSGQGWYVSHRLRRSLDPQLHPEQHVAASLGCAYGARERATRTRSLRPFGSTALCVGGPRCPSRHYNQTWRSHHCLSDANQSVCDHDHEPELSVHTCGVVLHLLRMMVLLPGIVLHLQRVTPCRHRDLSVLLLFVADCANLGRCWNTSARSRMVA